MKQRDPEPKTTRHAAKSSHPKSGVINSDLQDIPAETEAHIAPGTYSNPQMSKQKYIRQTKESLLAISHPLNSYWNGMLNPDSWNSAWWFKTLEIQKEDSHIILLWVRLKSANNLSQRESWRIISKRKKEQTFQRELWSAGGGHIANND